MGEPKFPPDVTTLGPSRMSAQGELAQRIKQLHAEASRLQKLLDALPHLQSDAEEALYELLIRQR